MQGEIYGEIGASSKHNVRITIIIDGWTSRVVGYKYACRKWAISKIEIRFNTPSFMIMISSHLTNRTRRRKVVDGLSSPLPNINRQRAIWRYDLLASESYIVGLMVGDIIWLNKSSIHTFLYILYNTHVNKMLWLTWRCALVI